MVQRVAPGQERPWNFPLARDWNGVGEATEIVLREARTQEPGKTKKLVIPTDWVLCQNDTGADRRAGDVLEIGEYLLDVFDPLNLWFSGTAPTDQVAQSTHGILLAETKDAQIMLARVQVSGAVRAWVDVTDEDHNFCDAEDGSYVLHSNSTGPHKIMWKPDGTGEAECVVLLYSSGGSSTCNLVRFRIISVDPTTRIALCEVLSIPAGCTDVPDSTLVDPFGTVIEVCDPNGCYFNEPQDDMTGRAGYARYMLPLFETTCQPGSGSGSGSGTGTSGNDFEPQWEVDSLCCAPISCDV